MKNIYENIIDLKKNNLKAVLCTVVDTKGSTPRKSGSKMIVCEDMTIFGTIGGGTLEKTVMEKCDDVFKSATPQLLTFNLTKDLGMVCGGSVDVFVEPLFKLFKLYIFGAGHIGKALTKHLSGLNFEIVVIDERQNIFADFNSDVVKINSCPFDTFIENHSADERTFIVIATTNHTSDLNILKNYINKPYAYLGVIGSKRKAEEIKKALLNEKLLSEDEFKNIDIPMGLDIMAEGPDEIAISIAAKLILEKNKLAVEIKK